ncbi:hypothetical protein A2U01_0091270, partial [Trifolium medium]|nr:hypothetical protein [Trifolium medium]
MIVSIVKVQLVELMMNDDSYGFGSWRGKIHAK